VRGGTSGNCLPPDDFGWPRNRRRESGAVVRCGTVPEREKWRAYLDPLPEGRRHYVVSGLALSNQVWRILCSASSHGQSWSARGYGRDRCLPLGLCERLATRHWWLSRRSAFMTLLDTDAIKNIM